MIVLEGKRMTDRAEVHGELKRGEIQRVPVRHVEGNPGDGAHARRTGRPDHVVQLCNVPADDGEGVTDLIACAIRLSFFVLLIIGIDVVPGSGDFFLPDPQGNEGFRRGGDACGRFLLRRRKLLRED